MDPIIEIRLFLFVIEQRKLQTGSAVRQDVRHLGLFVTDALKPTPPLAPSMDFPSGKKRKNP